jgi:hypothetical protein
MRMFLLKPFALLVRSPASQVHVGAIVLMALLVSSCNSRSPRKDLETGDGPDAFTRVESTEDTTLHDDASGSIGALGGGRTSGGSWR